jgi:NADPH:quinone reductase
LKALGLDHAVDYSKEGWVDAVRDITGGRGVDLVVDSVGGRVLAGSVQCLAYRDARSPSVARGGIRSCSTSRCSG